MDNDLGTGLRLRDLTDAEKAVMWDKYQQALVSAVEAAKKNANHGSEGKNQLLFSTSSSVAAFVA